MKPIALPVAHALAYVVPLVLAACAADGHGRAPVLSNTAATTTPASAAAPAARYRTFSFGAGESPPTGYHASAWSAVVHQAFEGLIAQALVEKGYRLTRGTGDIVITLGCGRREFEVHDAIDDNSLPSDVLNTTFVNGSLVVDVNDASTGRRVWRGANETQIPSDHIDTYLMSTSVRAILSSMPGPAEWPR
jgi:hypothetical protein